MNSYPPICLSSCPVIHSSVILLYLCLWAVTEADSKKVTQCPSNPKGPKQVLESQSFMDLTESMRIGGSRLSLRFISQILTLVAAIFQPIPRADEENVKPQWRRGRKLFQLTLRVVLLLFLSSLNLQISRIDYLNVGFTGQQEHLPPPLTRWIATESEMRSNMLTQGHFTGEMTRQRNNRNCLLRKQQRGPRLQGGQTPSQQLPQK